MKFALDAYEDTISDVSRETDFINARKLYDEDYSKFKSYIIQIARESGNLKTVTSYAQSGEQMISNITDGFSKAADNNARWAEQAAIDNTQLYRTVAIATVFVIVAAVAISLWLALYITGLISKPATLMKNMLQMMGMEGVVKFSDEESRQGEEYATARKTSITF